MKKLVIFFLLNFYCLSVYACDEDQFNRYLDDGNDTEAYELLEECEPLKNLSVDTLERIGAFYIRTDVINFPSEITEQSRAMKLTFMQLCRAAGGVFL